MVWKKRDRPSCRASRSEHASAALLRLSRSVHNVQRSNAGAHSAEGDERFDARRSRREFESKSLEMQPGERIEENVNHKHGHAGQGQSRTYRSWYQMWTRCTNPKADQFKYYGGRGIRVTERWHSFESFLQDMGERPKGMSLDRIQTEGNYCKANCRWADSDTQRRNKRTVIPITAFGLTLTLPEWSERTGIDRRVLWARRKRGNSPEKIVAEARP